MKNLNLIFKEKSEIIIVVFLIVLGAFSRLLPHPPNFSPLTSLALFGAVYLSRKSGLVLPLLAMFISDLFLGLYDWRLMTFVYGAFLLTVVLGWIFKKRKIVAVALGSLLGSVLFFILTNFAVWFFYDWYPKTLLGLETCFLQALPFFKNTILSSFLFSFGFFGIFEFLKKIILKRYSKMADMKVGF